MTRSAHPRTPRRGPQPSRRRGRPHVAVEDAETPGVCQVCKRPMEARSDMHVAVGDLPGVDPDITAAERRRLGETEE